MTAPIAIIMGSQSDWDTMRNAAETLTALGVACEKTHRSAHRTPDRLFAFAKGPSAAGYKDHHCRRRRRGHTCLGMTASLTELPVFGVPIESKALSGVDSLYSSYRCPPGFRLARWPSASRRHQRRVARGKRAGAERSRALQPAGRLAQAADQRR